MTVDNKELIPELRNRISHQFSRFLFTNKRSDMTYVEALAQVDIALRDVLDPPKQTPLDRLNVLKNIFPDVRDYYAIKEALEKARQQ